MTCAHGFIGACAICNGCGQITERPERKDPLPRKGRKLGMNASIWRGVMDGWDERRKIVEAGGFTEDQLAELRGAVNTVWCSGGRIQLSFGGLWIKGAFKAVEPSVSQDGGMPGPCGPFGSSIDAYVSVMTKLNAWLKEGAV